MARIDNYTIPSKKSAWDMKNGMFPAVTVSSKERDVTCTINGGEFWGGYCAVNCEGDGGKAPNPKEVVTIINGGTFFSQRAFIVDGESYSNDIYTLNGDGTIIVNGGQFIDFDPSDYIDDDIYEVVTKGTYTYTHTFLVPNGITVVSSTDTYIVNLLAAITAGGEPYSAPNAYGGYDTWVAEKINGGYDITETITVPVYGVVKKGPQPPTPPTPSGDGTPGNPYVVDEMVDLQAGSYYLYSNSGKPMLCFATASDEYVPVESVNSKQADPSDYGTGQLVYLDDQDIVRIVTWDTDKNVFTKFHYGETGVQSNPIPVFGMVLGYLMVGCYYDDAKSGLIYVATGTDTYEEYTPSTPGWTPEDPISISGADFEDLIGGGAAYSGYFYNVTSAGEKIGIGLYVTTSNSKYTEFDMANAIDSTIFGEWIKANKLIAETVYYITDTATVCIAYSENKYNEIERSNPK